MQISSEDAVAKIVAKYGSTDGFVSSLTSGMDDCTLSEVISIAVKSTADEYIAMSQNMANSFNEQFKGRANVAKRLDFGLLREKVFCGYCERIMQFQRTRITKGKNKCSWLLMFNCRNKEWIRQKPNEAMEKYGKKLPKSIRMKYVTEHIE